MFDGIYMLVPNVMDVIKTFHKDKAEERRLKQRAIARDTATVQRGDQPRVTKVGQSSKLKHVSFEGVEHETENYDRISEEEMRTIVQKEKTDQTPKRKIAKDVSLLPHEGELVYKKTDMLSNKTRKSNIGEPVKVVSSSEEQIESSYGSREIITPGAELEDGIIKTKQNAIRQELRKNKLILGGQTFELNVNQFYGPDEGQSQYQIRKAHHLHVHNLKTLFRFNPYAHVVDYVVLVDPCQVPNKQAFDKTKCFDYKYYVIGGNHSIEAKRQLIAEYPNNYLFQTVKCIIYAGLTEMESKLLAWDHNADNEYRMKMTFIQRVRFIHNEFIEKCGGDKTQVSVAFRKECLMETGYQIDEKKAKDGKLNTNLFRGTDNIFQLAFRTGEVWDLIDEIFDRWENISIKNQKVKKSKPIICTNSKGGPEMKQLPEDMTITPWRTMQGVKDDKLVKSVLARVKSGELSMEEMCAEFQK